MVHTLHLILSRQVFWNSASYLKCNKTTSVTFCPSFNVLHSVSMQPHKVTDQTDILNQPLSKTVGGRAWKEGQSQTQRMHTKQNMYQFFLHLTDSVLPLPSLVGGRELEPQLAFVDSSGKWRAVDHRHSDHHHLCVGHYCTHWYMAQHELYTTVVYVRTCVSFCRQECQKIKEVIDTFTFASSTSFILCARVVNRMQLLRAYVHYIAVLMLIGLRTSTDR